MFRVRRFVMAAVATLVIASACTSISGPTTPPGTTPNIPPVNIPTMPPTGNGGVGGFTMPPIALPSGLNFPPIALPSGLNLPPIALPSADASAGICPLVSPAEMSQIMGANATVTEADSESCAYTLPNFATVTVTISTDSDMSGAKFLMGNTAQDVSIGGLPGLTGTFMGQGLVYVQKAPGKQLNVMGILTGADEATMAKLVQVATLAVGRWQ